MMDEAKECEEFQQRFRSVPFGDAEEKMPN